LAGGIFGGPTNIVPGGFYGGGRAAGGPIQSGKFYTVGENGPETLVAGSNGHIIPSRGGGGNQQVNIYNYSGAQVQQSKRREGNRDILEIVIGKVGRAIADGKYDSLMSQKYGLRPSLANR